MRHHETPAWDVPVPRQRAEVQPTGTVSTLGPLRRTFAVGTAPLLPDACRAPVKIQYTVIHWESSARPANRRSPQPVLALVLSTVEGYVAGQFNQVRSFSQNPVSIQGSHCSLNCCADECCCWPTVDDPAIRSNTDSCLYAQMQQVPVHLAR